MTHEHWNSREMNITLEGTSATIVYDTTWTEWDAGGGDGITFPVIGDTFDAWPTHYDLRCTRIRTRAIDNVNCQIICTFSTSSIDAREKREDQITSWEFYWDVGTESISYNSYVDYGDSNKVKSWSEYWLALANATEENIPELRRYESQISLRCVIYSSVFYFNRINNVINRVNSDRFTDWVFSQQAAVGRMEREDTSWDDRDQWLCVGAPVTRERLTCWKYEIILMYKKNGWNYIRNPDGTLVHMDLYETIDFVSLFDGMTNQDDDVWGGR